MGFFSNLFAPPKPTAEEIAANNMKRLAHKLRELTLKLVHGRISQQEGKNVTGLEKLSDYEVSALPESSLVTMAAIYRRCIAEGASHEVALQVLNSTRALPIQWKDISKFQTIEGYIVERLKVELAHPSLSSTTLKYFTDELISDSVQEINKIFNEIFGSQRQEVL